MNRGICSSELVLRRVRTFIEFKRSMHSAMIEIEKTKDLLVLETKRRKIAEAALEEEQIQLNSRIDNLDTAHLLKVDDELIRLENKIDRKRNETKQEKISPRIWLKTWNKIEMMSPPVRTAQEMLHEYYEAVDSVGGDKVPFETFKTVLTNVSCEMGFAFNGIEVNCLKRSRFL